MNTRYDTHAPFAHAHRSHPVSLLSTAVAAADKELIAKLELHEDIQLWPSTNGKPLESPAEMISRSGLRRNRKSREGQAVHQPLRTTAMLISQLSSKLSERRRTPRAAATARMPTGTAESDILVH
jgi:hypothetical protein